MSLFDDHARTAPGSSGAYQQIYGVLDDGTVPDIFMDFKDAIYQSQGEDVALNTLLTQNTDWGTWNPGTMISAGAGINGVGPSAPVLTGDAFDLVASGATILLSFSGTNSYLRYEMIDDLVDYNTYYYTRLSFGVATNNIGDQVADDVTEATLSDGAHKCALTMMDGKISRSTDGNAIITINPAAAWSPAPSVMGFIIHSDTILESCAIYPAQDDADLPALSSL